MVLVDLKVLEAMNWIVKRKINFLILMWEKIKKLNDRLLLTIVLLLCINAIWTKPLNAQGFSISPSEIEVLAVRGRRSVIEFEINPQTSESVPIEISVIDKNFLDDNIDPVKWFDFRSELTVNGEKIKFEIMFTPPFTIVGDLEFDLVFSRAEIDDGDFIRMGFRIPLSIRVQGGRIYTKTRLEELTVEDQVINGDDRSVLEIRLKNIGNLTSPATLNTELLMKSGRSYRPYGRFDFEFPKILPNQDVLGRIIMDQVLPDGQYLAKTRTAHLSGSERVVETSFLRQSNGSAESFGVSESGIFAVLKPVIELDISPGASRFFTNELQNLTNEPRSASVNLSSENSYVNIMNSQIRLGPFMTKNLVGQAVMPDDDFDMIIEFLKISSPNMDSFEVPVVIRNPQGNLSKIVSMGLPVVKFEKLTHQLVWTVTNSGDDYFRPNFRLIIRDEQLSTAHRVVFTDAPKLLPLDSFTFKYEIISRISQNPGRYTVSFESDCCILRVAPTTFTVEDDNSVKIVR